MSEHNIFFGGNRTRNLGYSMLPSTDVEPDQHFESDDRRGNVLFSLTRTITFAGYSKCGCGQKKDSDALCHYLECNDIKEGDVLNTHIMPKHASLERIWFNNLKAVEGVVFDVVLRGNAASLGGTPTAPEQVLLMEDVTLDEVGSSLLVLPAPVYFDQNDMVQIVLKSLPDSGVQCMCMQLSPVVHEYCRGEN